MRPKTGRNYPFPDADLRLGKRPRPASEGPACGIEGQPGAAIKSRPRNRRLTFATLGDERKSVSKIGREQAHDPVTKSSAQAASLHIRQAERLRHERLRLLYQVHSASATL